MKGHFGGMRKTFAESVLLAFAVGLAALACLNSAIAADCPGNPGALGTSRTIAVDPTEHQRLGSFQYRESLPLNDREVVLTFDDGPLPPYTSRILDTLASECVKATFFLVGRMAHSYPHLVRRAYAEGHTIGNHSQNHPFTFHRMTVEQAASEIENGYASIRAALDNPRGASDFFRIPGLLRQEPVERYLGAKGYMTWSVDFMADDWTHISSNEVVRRAINRLEARGKGILLLHDIKPKTALALPILLHELKARGFKIVHVVQADAEHPKTATLPEQWTVTRSVRTETAELWPEPVASLALPDPVLDVPSVNNFGIAAGRYTNGTVVPGTDRLRGSDGDIPLPPVSLWPRSVRLVAVQSAETLPAPDATYFRYSRVWKQRPVTRIAHRHDHKKSTTAAATTLGAPGLGAPKPANGRVTRSTTTPHQAPRPPRPTGHQLTPPRPATLGFLQHLGVP